MRDINPAPIMRLSDVDLTDLDRFADGFPHEVFTFLRREAPVWFHPPTRHTPGGEGFWALTRYDDVVAAAADAETFSSVGGGTREGGGTIIEDLPRGFAAGVLLNMMDDPRHQQIRRMVTPAVSPKALARIEDDLRARADAIVGDALDRGECDFLLDVAAELPLQAAAALLGVPQEDRHKLFDWANATLDYEGRDLGQSTERSQAAQAEMFAYGSALVAEKQRCPADDMLSAVANGDGVTDLESQMFFNLLIAAASETTRNTIAVGVMALVDHPDQLDTLRADRVRMPTAVEEILRWASSTPYNRRTATRDVDVRGQRIRAGDKVTLWWASANRDGEVFVDPFRFDVTRTPNHHLTFGHGGHFCLGATLARVEVRLILEQLLDRVAIIELIAPPVWTRSNKHTGVRHMPVRLTPC
jgi:cytochrome P450